MATSHKYKIKKTHPTCPNCSINSSVNRLYDLPNKFIIYFCRNCSIGFSYPVPKNLDRYYHTNYWKTPGIIGLAKELIFNFFQKRRVDWITSYVKKGKILDVGAGEGNFAKNVDKNYKVTSVDSLNAKIKNPEVERIDFVKWDPKEKFDSVVFWESLEHTTNPPAYLNKAHDILNKNGLIFIEYPRFNSLESKIFGKHWFHLDAPRHTYHLTDGGLSTLLKRTGFTLIEQKSIPAFEYTLWGFCASVLNIAEIRSTDDLKKLENIMIIFLLIPLSVASLIFELILLPLKQSPIGLIVASK